MIVNQFLRAALRWLRTRQIIRSANLYPTARINARVKCSRSRRDDSGQWTRLFKTFLLRSKPCCRQSMVVGRPVLEFGRNNYLEAFVLFALRYSSRRTWPDIAVRRTWPDIAVRRRRSNLPKKNTNIVRERDQCDHSTVRICIRTVSLRSSILFSIRTLLDSYSSRFVLFSIRTLLDSILFSTNLTRYRLDELDPTSPRQRRSNLPRRRRSNLPKHKFLGYSQSIWKHSVSFSSYMTHVLVE